MNQAYTSLYAGGGGNCSSSTSTEKPPQPSKYSPFLHFSILAGSSIYYIVVRHSLRGCSFFMEVIGIDPLSDAGKIRSLTSGIENRKDQIIKFFLK